MRDDMEYVEHSSPPSGHTTVIIMYILCHTTIGVPTDENSVSLPLPFSGVEYFFRVTATNEEGFPCSPALQILWSFCMHRIVESIAVWGVSLRELMLPCVY